MDKKSDKKVVLMLSPKIDNLPDRFADKTMKNYMVMPHNKKQYEFCKNYKGEQTVLLTGAIGNGKTHLAVAMLKQMPMQLIKEQNQIIYNERELRIEIENERDSAIKARLEAALANELYKYRPARCLFVSVIEMLFEINAAAMDDTGRYPVLRKYATNRFYDLILFDGLFDDFDAKKLTDAKKDDLYYIINSRYLYNLPCIITSNRKIEEINEIDPRIASRFSEMAAIIDFNGPDYRKKQNN